MPRRRTLPDQAQALIAEIYDQSGLTVDALPYTEEFEMMFEDFLRRSGFTMTRHDFWRALAAQRKSSRLTRKRR